MARLFISHSSKDDGFVRDLRAALADYGQDVWIDSRELRGGDPLWPEIQRGIEAASAYAVLVSAEALQSTWVGKELQHALSLRKERGKENDPVIPLSLDGTRLGVLETIFGEEPTYVSVSSGAGGVETAMDSILVALRLRMSVHGKAEPSLHTRSHRSRNAVVSSTLRCGLHVMYFATSASLAYVSNMTCASPAAPGLAISRAVSHLGSGRTVMDSSIFRPARITTMA
jgi:hypothetical protein